ncbi:MAG TPA: YicC/YloC family endoribonuclease [Pirellulales bacterium]|nr:YicC/YloC family endoribonuclease [Pirellulales bacterium]
MLLSMTGFGEAHYQGDGITIAVELRTINSRYFKLSVKCGEGYSALEAEIENVVRQQIRRGTLQVTLQIHRTKASDDYQINTAVLDSYRRQLAALGQQWHLSDSVSLDRLLSLPGVVTEHIPSADDAERDWPLIRSTLETAMENLARMRSDEGRAMATDLRANCQAVAAELAEIERRVPLVSESYRQRLAERLQTVLTEYQVTLDPSDVIKEVSIFAERSDISEEIVRLRSHLQQFDSIMGLPESSGRKLDFLTQEMFRETNTIGSKANDTEIARRVIDVKAAIERIREMIQNVE